MDRGAKFQQLITEIRQFCVTDVKEFDTIAWQVLAEYLAGELRTIEKCLETHTVPLAQTLLKSTLENYDQWKNGDK